LRLTGRIQVRQVMNDVLGSGRGVSLGSH
jgi:hypothetical protein